MRIIIKPMYLQIENRPNVACSSVAPLILRSHTYLKRQLLKALPRLGIVQPAKEAANFAKLDGQNFHF